MNIIYRIIYKMMSLFDDGNSPKTISVRVRVYLLKKLGCRLGDNVNIQPGVNILHSHNNLIIGDNSGVGARASLHLQGKLKIGSNVMIGQELIVHTATHGMENNGILMCNQMSEVSEIIIGSDVWIGSRVTILPGVKIGDGVVIGTGSIVTKNLNHYGVYAGNPAKLIRQRV